MLRRLRNTILWVLAIAPALAALLGFADQSSFTRAVHRWYGKAPRAVRRAIANSGKAPGTKKRS